MDRGVGMSVGMCANQNHVCGHLCRHTCRRVCRDIDICAHELMMIFGLCLNVYGLCIGVHIDMFTYMARIFMDICVDL